MSTLAALALATAAGGAPDWRPFDLRQRGWTESQAYYDAASLEVRGDRVRVWIYHEVGLSGLPNPEMRDRIELDCPARRARRLESVRVQGELRSHSRRPTRFEPIATDSLLEKLEQSVCPAPQVGS